MIDRIKCCNVLCDVGAHVSVMSSKVYAMLFNETPNLDATIIKLIMGDGRLIKPQDDQDGELVETMEELKPQHGNLEEEKFEDIREFDQEEDGTPDVEMKPLPKGLKYKFLGDGKTFPVIISDELSPEETEKLLNLLKKHKKVIGYSINDLKGISPAFCTHRIQLEEQYKPVVEHQRRLSHSMRDVVKKEVIKLLNAGIIYPVPRSE